MTNEELTEIMVEILEQMREANGFLIEQRKITEELYTHLYGLINLQKKTIGLLQDVIQKEINDGRGESGGDGPKAL